MTKAEGTGSSPRSGWLAPLVCALLAAAVHVPALRAGFVWDDLSVQRHQVPYFRSLGDAFHPPRGLAQWSGNYFRPVVVLTYMADDRLNDSLLGPAGFDLDVRGDPARARIPHATTLIFHALAAAAVTMLAFRCLSGRPGAQTGAWAAGLVFALHPIHVEVAAAVAGRSDSLAAFLLLASILMALRGRELGSLPTLAGGAVLFLLALLTKEAAVAGVVLLPLVFAMAPATKVEGDEGKIRARPSLAAPVLFAGAAVVYAVLRSYAGTGAGTPLEPDPSILLRAASFYAGKLLFPWPHTPYVPELPGTAYAAVSLTAGTTLGGIALWRWRKGDSFYILCFLWIAAACLPPLAIVVRDVAKAAVAERHLYLPSVGMALAVGGIASAVSVSRGGWKKRVATVLFAVILTAGAVVSFSSTRVWRSGRTLWTYVTSQEGQARHALGWANLGTSLFNEGDIVAAERAYAKASDPALAAEPDLRANAVNGLGMVRYRLADTAYRQSRPEEALRLLAEAEGYFSAAAMADPTLWGYWRNLAATRLLRVDIGASLTGRPDRELLARARRDIEEGLRVMPGNVEMLRLRSEHDAIARRWMGTR